MPLRLFSFCGHQEEPGESKPGQGGPEGRGHLETGGEGLLGPRGQAGGGRAAGYQGSGGWSGKGGSVHLGSTWSCYCRLCWKAGLAGPPAAPPHRPQLPAPPPPWSSPSTPPPPRPLSSRVPVSPLPCTLSPGSHSHPDFQTRAAAPDASLASLRHLELSSVRSLPCTRQVAEAAGRTSGQPCLPAGSAHPPQTP